jgi:hypothetical protein
MNIINTVIRMYYIPTHYYWLDQNNLSIEIVDELYINYKNSKEIFHRNKKIINKLIEKTTEYTEYKSNLIRLILFDYVHNHPNETGKELILNILHKWKNIKSIKNLKLKDKELIYNRTISNILKCEKVINNMEDIMMSINLNMLENYYE